MAMKGAKENLYVAAITVRSLDFIITRKTTVATWLPQLLLKGHRRSLCWEYLWNHPKVSVAVDVISMAGDAAHLTTHVGKEKATVMEREMED